MAFRSRAQCAPREWFFSGGPAPPHSPTFPPTPWQSCSKSRGPEGSKGLPSSHGYMGIADATGRVISRLSRLFLLPLKSWERVHIGGHREALTSVPPSLVFSTEPRCRTTSSGTVSMYTSIMGDTAIHSHQIPPHTSIMSDTTIHGHHERYRHTRAS